MAARFLVLAAALTTLGVGCVHATVDIPASELTALQHGDHHRGLLLHDRDGHPVRLDPNTAVRFRHTDGTVTPWFAARTLRVDAAGVRGDVDIDPETITAIAVDGLAAEGRAVLVEDGWVPRADGLLARGEDGSLPTTFASVIRRLAWLNASGNDLRMIAKCELPPYGGALAQGCRDARAEDVVQQFKLAGSPGLGRWTLDAGTSGRLGRIDGIALAQRFDTSATITVTHGVPWSALAGAQLTNVDGWRSARTLVGGVAWYGMFTLVTLPYTLLFHASPDVPEVPGSADTHVEPGAPSASTALASDGSRLFAFTARARAYARPILSLDSGLALHRADGVWNGATLVVRFADTFELGAGVRQIAFEQGGKLLASTAASIRLGVHYDLDADRRFALAFGFDAGALSGDDQEVRFYAGVRMRVSDHAFVGLFPANPTYAWAKSPTDTSPHGGRLPTAVEIGWAF